MKLIVPTFAAPALLAGCTESPGSDASERSPTSAERPSATAEVPVSPRAVVVRVSVEPYEGDPPGPCATDCDAVVVEAEGLAPAQGHRYTTNIVSSTGGAPLAGQLDADGSGVARVEVAYYDRTVFDERYCVTLAETEECVDGR